MNDTNTIQDGILSETYSDLSRTEGAKIIPYPGIAKIITNHIDNTSSYLTSLERTDQFQPYRARKDLRDKNILNQIRSTLDKELFNNAYYLIVDALDLEIDRIERSNFFDEWKDTLKRILSDVTNISVNHRKILGALNVVTKGKDIADFTSEGLNIFRDATYTFRQLRVSKGDTNRIINSLINIGVCEVIPLSGDGVSDEEEKRLEKFMMLMIEKSKKA